MPEAGGWNFWVETGGTVREFVVATEDEQAAQAALQAHDPALTEQAIMTRQKLPSSAIAFHGLQPGDVKEMVPGSEGTRWDDGGVDLKRPV